MLKVGVMVWLVVLVLVSVPAFVTVPPVPAKGELAEPDSVMVPPD